VFTGIPRGLKQITTDKRYDLIGNDSAREGWGVTRWEGGVIFDKAVWMKRLALSAGAVKVGQFGAMYFECRFRRSNALLRGGTKLFRRQDSVIANTIVPKSER
jgi:hypothetical protein